MNGPILLRSNDHVCISRLLLMANSALIRDSHCMTMETRQRRVKVTTFPPANEWNSFRTTRKAPEISLFVRILEQRGSLTILDGFPAWPVWLVKGDAKDR
ncbi:unnamed protein product [Nesidiocoris tenuis]|uniref:Uncharacterized protein n=1 Tax=Nesidiocoris tenuis TaxID=355587 RepID=A0A6H5GE55_9HEMI|nr:unnamed protein product [Nesidiocoris tenuis]